MSEQEGQQAATVAASVGPSAAGGGIMLMYGTWRLRAGSPVLPIPQDSGLTLGDVGAIECWFRTAPDTGPAGVVINVGELAVSVASGGTADDASGSDDADEQASAASSGFHHLVVTPAPDDSDGRGTEFAAGFHHLMVMPASGEVRLDGSTVAQVALDATGLSASLDGFRIGGKYREGDRALRDGFTGDIAGVRLWSTELDDASRQASSSQSSADPRPPFPEFLPDVFTDQRTWPLLGSTFGTQGTDGFIWTSNGPWLNRRDDQALPEQIEIDGVDADDHGIYQTAVYVSMVYDQQQHRRKLVASDGGPWIVEADATDPLRATITHAGREGDTDTVETTAVMSLMTGAPGFRISESNDPFVLDGRYILPTREGEAWNKGFTTLPGNLQFSLAGWDLRTADIPPTTPQSTGCDQLVFAGPTDKTEGALFRMVTLGKGNFAVLPLGLRYAPRSTSSSGAVTRSSSNSTEWSTMTSWGQSWDVGAEGKADVRAGMAKGGVEGSFDYSCNHNHQHGEHELRQNGTSRANTTATVAEYALVLDPGTATLTDKFRNLVEAIVELGDSGDYDDLFEMFGTHYAYAITYGGRGWRSTDIDDETLQSSFDNGWSIDRKLTVGFGVHGGVGKKKGPGGDVSMKEKGSHETNSSEDDTQDQTETGSLTVDTIRSYGSITGLDSIHEGGSNPLPVFVQLRPITDLLAPPYFTDPRIVVDLRAKAALSVAALLSGGDADDWGKYFVEFTATEDRASWDVTFLNRPKRTVASNRLQTVFSGIADITYVGTASDSPTTIADLANGRPVRAIVPANVDSIPFALVDLDNGDGLEVPLPGPRKDDVGIYHQGTYVTARIVPTDDIIAGAWSEPAADDRSTT